MEQWKPLDTVGETGSEGGVIVRDEAADGCRITLEQCSDYDAITCGIAGAFVHTAFCGAKESSTVFEQMKQEISAFLERDTTPEEEYRFYKQFANKY